MDWLSSEDFSIMLIYSRENKLANTSGLGSPSSFFFASCRERDLWIWWTEAARPALKGTPADAPPKTTIAANGENDDLLHRTLPTNR